jgi:hypothetical protein
MGRIVKTGTRHSISALLHGRETCGAHQLLRTDRYFCCVGYLSANAAKLESPEV